MADKPKFDTSFNFGFNVPGAKVKKAKKAKAGKKKPGGAGGS